jgi:hypothetical protein
MHDMDLIWKAYVFVDELFYLNINDKIDKEFNKKERC